MARAWRTAGLAAGLWLLGCASARAFTFAPNLAPPAPFPLVTGNALETEFVAPGLTLAQYSVLTASGPLAVNVLAIDPREPTLRLDTALAADRLVSGGETTSAMALRTGAVAGINADYFDIGSTNQPLGVLVRGGVLLHSPGRFAALAIDKRKAAVFGIFHFSGSATYGNTTIPITGWNEWPPQGGASLVTPQLGTLAPAADVTRVRLEALDGAGGDLRYRAVGVESGAVAASGLTALALGPALAASAPPQPGDIITVRYAVEPPLADLQGAVGGGPILVKDGAPFDDPIAPAASERDKRFPVVGAARSADGTILLIEVDGRQPLYSIGLTRPEFGALMRGFGAVEGIAFDSGGSATLVARRLGDAQPSVRNSPSDGRERPVADGLFVYSDAPLGPPARLVVRPQHAWLLAKSSIPLWSAVTDRAGHVLSAAQAPLNGTTLPGGVATLGPNGTLTAAATRASGILRVHRGSLESDVLVDVVPAIDRLTVLPAHPNPDPGGSVDFRALGYDRNAHAIALGDQVNWHATSGRIDRAGRFTAGNDDAVIEADAPGRHETIRVPVGRHAADLAIFNEAAGDQAAVQWTFAATPPDGPGYARTNEDCAACLALGYDFSGTGKGASALAGLALGGEPLALSVEILGDGSGVAVRVVYLNGAGERFTSTLARNVDWHGWQRRELRFPPNAIAPLRLLGFALAANSSHSSGMIALRGARITLAGTQTPVPLFRSERSGG